MRINDSEEGQHPPLQPSRRSALKYGSLAIGSATVAMLGPLEAIAAASGDVGIMQVALALEHEGIAAYMIAGKSGLLSQDTLKVATLFMNHHQQHRDALANLIKKGGGKPVEPKSDDAYVKELDLGSLKTEGDVVMLATKLEMGAANAYSGQVAALKDRKLAHLFTQLCADEAVHWTTLNNALKRPIPDKAFIFA